jgi:hypothetical protein
VAEDNLVAVRQHGWWVVRVLVFVLSYRAHLIRVVKKLPLKNKYNPSSVDNSLFYFSQKHQIKNILTFLHFLHHINNFLLLFNQKNSLQNKTFSLFYKTFSNFLSHQSFLTTIQINIPIHNHLPNKPFYHLIKPS